MFDTLTALMNNFKTNTGFLGLSSEGIKRKRKETAFLSLLSSSSHFPYISSLLPTLLSSVSLLPAILPSRSSYTIVVCLSSSVLSAYLFPSQSSSFSSISPSVLLYLFCYVSITSPSSFHLSLSPSPLSSLSLPLHHLR